MPVLLFLALLPCRTSPAQPQGPTLPPEISIAPMEAETRRLLASSDPRDRSWGAYFVGRFGLEDMVPEVVPLLDSSWPFGSSGERKFLVHAALDSLIQLRAKLPSEVLLPLYEQAPDAVVILLALHPEENQAALLSLAGRPASYVRWLAISNLLAGMKAPGFAALVLREFRIVLDVTVSDSGSIGIGGGSGGSVGNGTYAQRWPGHPPTGTYELTTKAEPGFMIVAPGRRVVYAQRSIVYPARDSGNFDGDPIGGARDEERLHYLAGLLDMAVEGLPLRQRYSRAIAYRRPQGFLDEVETLVGHIRASHAAVVEQLLASGQLGRDEASPLHPRIHVRVRDLRTGSPSALPAVPSVELLE